jgi:succinate dehydrogenase / fumarate reductase cytochrome b subunit
MNITNLFGSSVGKKFIMAVSGLALFLFVVGHLAGNLQVFLGWDEINRYGDFLQTNLEIIWPARIGLLVMVSLHIWSAIKLHSENKAARPRRYAKDVVVAASYASRTMIWSGLIVLAFIIYHLLHFTLVVEAINFTGRDFETLRDAKMRHDIFAMMVLGFEHPVVAIGYMVAMSLLCLHLSHGLSAMFQSLGWKTPAYAPLIDCGARAVAWLIFLGYISIPFSILICRYGHAYLVERGLAR